MAPRIVLDGMIRPGTVRWDGAVLWAADRDDRRVLRLDLDTGDVSTAAFLVGDRPAGFGWMEGHLVVGAEASRLVLRQDAEGRLTPLASLESVCRGEVHDLVVAPNDVAYVTDYGTTHLAGGWREPGRILAVDADGAVEVVAEGLELPTGLAVTADCSVLFAAERVGGRILAFGVSADGTLGEAVEFATVPSRVGHHEAGSGALTVDDAGRLWCVDEVGRQVVGFEQDGTVVSVFELPDGITPAGVAVIGDPGTVVVAGGPVDGRTGRREGCLFVLDPVSA